MNQEAQWTAEIVVNAPLKRLWEVVDDIPQIPRYHPEVDKVDLIAGQARRSLGTKYQCNILEGSRAGSCVEEVVAYEPESMVVTRMVSDTWGIDRMLADFRLVSTVSSRSDASTILKFEAFYKPVGLKNRLLNAWFLRRALRKRSLAVMNGIKRVAEGKVNGAMAGAPPVRERGRFALRQLEDRRMILEKAKERSRNAFNRKARRYDETLAGWHSAMMKKAALAHLMPPVSGSLLDVGCGRGLLLATLARQCPELRLAGLDIAPEMVRVATDRLGGRADVRAGDAESLPWEDHSFDYIFCVDSFHHYPNPQRALSEFQRVLKPSGHLILADPTAPSPIRQLINPLNRLLRNGDVKMYDQREMTNMLAACKFGEIEWRKVGLWGFVASALVR